ncbi:MAG: nitroreductase family protein [Patescibacteria group bacterium]
MNIFDLIKNRRSIRKFSQTKRVTEAQIDKLLEVARWAPSAGNFQSYFLFAIRNQELKEKLTKATLNQKHVSDASVVFVACADKKRISLYGERGRNLYCIQDATIALYNIWLALTEMGLAAVWVGAINESKVSKTLKLPFYLRPIALLPIGYPLESPKPTRRRNLNKISKKL